MKLQAEVQAKDNLNHQLQNEIMAKDKVSGLSMLGVTIYHNG